MNDLLEEFLSEIPLFMDKYKWQFYFINRYKQIGDEGCKGLGDGIRTLVNLTSLQLDLVYMIFKKDFSLRSLSLWTNINDNFILYNIMINTS